MYAHQGQLVTFSTTFRTAAGLPVAVRQANPVEHPEASLGCTVAISRGGRAQHAGLATAGDEPGRYDVSLTLYHHQWPTGSYRVVFSGYTPSGAAAEQSFDLEIMKSYLFAKVGKSWPLSDLIPFLSDAVASGPHSVTGEVAFGQCDGVNVSFNVYGRNLEPGSETVHVVSASAVTPMERGTDYAIDNAIGTLTMLAPPDPGCAVTVGYRHSTYGPEELLQALVRGATKLQSGAVVRLINEVQPCLDTDPATIMGLMMKAGQIAVMEMQAHRDARSSFDWSSQGMSVKKVLLPRNEIQLLAQENASLEAEIGRFRMSSIGVRPQQDVYRPQPEIIVSTVFEVDA